MNAVPLPLCWGPPNLRCPLNCLAHFFLLGPPPQLALLGETNFISFFVLGPLYRVADGAFGVVVCDDCKYGVYGAVYGHNDVYRACIIGSYDVHESS